MKIKIRIGRGVFAVMILMAAFVSSCTMNTPSKGIKIGRIVKLSECGVLFTTCEGELLRGGLMDGSGSMGASFNFTIESRALKYLAHKYLEDQCEVKMSYTTPLFAWLGRSERSCPCFVTGIERNQ